MEKIREYRSQAMQKLTMDGIFMEKQVSSFYARIGKSVFDRIMSIIIITVSSPVMLLIAVLVKINSKGLILFSQKRVGLHNIEFTMYKFRSMYVDAPAYSEKPNSPDDPRITSVGRWLRKTSLDELPQLFNVLKGEMSLVGPRPEMPFLAQQYNDWENQRHLVKPGMTGLWQLSPDRNKSIREGIPYDLEYIKKLSFVNDLKILFRTFRVFFGGDTY
jgi:lipopolysaccharide/colanic/teichoic acid biosynthesis glycosyltransferase